MRFNQQKILRFIFNPLYYLVSERQSGHKVLKFSDIRKLCCNLPKIQEKRPSLRVFRQKDANEIANSEDPDQTALEEQSDLGLHCLPRPICPKTLDHYCTHEKRRDQDTKPRCY